MIAVPPSSVDEIDPRDLAREWYRHRRWIAGLTIAAAIAAAAINANLPKHYESTARIVFLPRLGAETLDSTPDTDRLALGPKRLAELAHDLATSDPVLQELRRLLPSATADSDYAVSADGKKQLVLSVRAADPRQAMTAATAWANLIERQLWHALVADEAGLQEIDRKLSAARDDLQRRQLELTAFVAGHPRETLSARLHQAQISLEARIAKCNAIDLLDTDLRAADVALGVVGDGQPLPPAFAQRLAALQWQVAGNPKPDAAPPPSPPPTSDTTVASARAALRGLESQLQAQRSLLDRDLVAWTNSVAAWSVEWESNQSEHDRLTRQFDLATRKCDALAADLETTRGRIAQSRSVVRVVPPPGPANRPVNFHPGRYAALAAALVLAGSVLVAFLSGGKPLR